MELRLPLPKLVCPSCSAHEDKSVRGMAPDYVHAQITLAEEVGKKARTVPIKIKRLHFEALGDGRTKAKVTARVPCLDGDHLHDVDVSDLFTAPTLFLAGVRRCPEGHVMTFEPAGVWDYVDDDAFGGIIEFSGVLRCAECRTAAETGLRAPAPFGLEPQEPIEVDFKTAKEVAPGTFSASVD